MLVKPFLLIKRYLKLHGNRPAKVIYYQIGYICISTKCRRSLIMHSMVKRSVNATSGSYPYRETSNTDQMQVCQSMNKSKEVFTISLGWLIIDFLLFSPRIFHGYIDKSPLPLKSCKKFKPVIHPCGFGARRGLYRAMFADTGPRSTRSHPKER